MAVRQVAMREIGPGILGGATIASGGWLATSYGRAARAR